MLSQIVTQTDANKSNKQWSKLVISKESILKHELTRSGIVGDGAGDDEDSGTDGSADADKDEVEEAEAANEAVAAGDYADGGGFRLGRR